MNKYALLLDENLSPLLVDQLPPLGTVAHVRQVGLRGADDAAIWRWAKDNCTAVVTKDSDFLDLATRFGPPPKVVQLRLGNCATADVAAALLAGAPAILAFLTQPGSAVLLVERNA